MNLDSPFLLIYMLPLLELQAKRDRHQQINGSEHMLVTVKLENNHVVSGSEVKVPVPLCKCLSAAGYHGNPNRVLQWAALYKVA